MTQPATPKSVRGSGIPIGGKKTPRNVASPKSVKSATKPAEEATTPVEEATKPVEEATKPVADEATKQVDESSNPDEPSTPTPQPEELEDEAENTAETAKEKPEHLDEAIDLGDDEKPTENEELPTDEEHEEHEEEHEEYEDNGEEDQTNVEAPSELDELEPEAEPEEGEGEEEVEQLEEDGNEIAETEVPESEAPEAEVPAAEAPKETGDALDAAKEAGENQVGDAADKAGEVAEEGADQVDEKAEDAVAEAPGAEDALESAKEGGEDQVGDATDKAGDVGEEGADQIGEKAGEAEETVPEGDVGEKVEEGAEQAEGEVKGAEDGAEDAAEGALDFSILEGKKVNKGGFIVDENGDVFGRLVEGEAKKCNGKKVDAEGNIWNDSGKIIGRAEPTERESTSHAPFEDFPDATVDKSGKILFEGRQVGIVTDGELKLLIGKKVDEDGDILDSKGNVLGKAERQDEQDPEPEPEPEPEEEVKIDCSSLAGLKVNKAGNVVSKDGDLIGHVVQGVLRALVNRKVDAEGNIYNDNGKVIGRAEPIPDDEKEEQVDTPFEDFPGSIVQKNGDVLYEGKKIGVVSDGDASKLAGKTVDEEGDIVDKNGTVLGKAERWEEEEVPEEKVDMSILAGKRVNKLGNVVDSSGTIFGKIFEGEIKNLAGKMCDKQGFVRNESGDVVGKAELVSEGDREGMKTGPFADFPDATVTKDGKVTSSQGIIGRLIEGSADKLFSKQVDEDGDVLDKNGNVLGKCERWEEPKEEEPEVEVHPLAGLKVNKAGEVYNSDGELVGKLTEGLLSRCAGQKIDNDGDVVDKKGDGIGHVSLLEDIPESEDVHPLSGLRVNKSGDVYDNNGELVGKLTEGLASRCAGQKIDDDGDVVDQKGNGIGHVSLIGDIPEEEVEPEAEEPTETEEEKAKRLQAEEDTKLAQKMSTCIQQSLEQIQPIMKMITENIEKAERVPKEELDEQKVVDEVKPLIEEGGRILQEANGVIRGLDPDGRIAANAKHKTAAREASPEEYRLADLLKELTGTVTTTIDKAKKKIADMPHVKKELNPLWGLLSEPLFQILAAVGLLLSGVLGLVGQLLNGLGLGGLVNGILGGLGLTRVLDNLGLGKILAPITGSKKK